ncbi:potassium channel family protein [Pontivivens ytuae]|uniref:Two pore domain potassium channel family protein n=1 Tax=Pontivivens ytuae TaxID=2789856 RepID=A0A7S9LVN9_9RHOB|nr:potassium channel family protein [Pontivivens ytuae]QPH55560.1 two pore domain potassium channel family protein [Pontivivens ytuae]
MSLMLQILLGSLLLCLCALIHAGAVALSLPGLIRPVRAVRRLGPRIKAMALLSFSLVFIVAAHTIQIWLWALVFFVMEVFEEFSTSFYFSIATYTTLGYGDVTLGPDLRVFGAFASATGLLTFGISTAFLFAAIERLMRGPANARRAPSE